MVKTKIFNPPALGFPVGYSNGVESKGFLFVSGQIGAVPEGEGKWKVVSSDFVSQFEKALENVLEVVKAAGGQSENVLEMTIFVKNMKAYRSARKSLADVWKRRMGRHYPAATLVEVSDLFERGTLVEIRAVASME